MSFYDNENERRSLKEHIGKLVTHPDFRPVKLKEMAVLLQILREDREELEILLQEMVKEGKLGFSRRGKFGLPESLVLTGTFTATPRGFGFVTVEGVEEDYYVPADRCGTAMHGDKVQITQLIPDGGKRREARIVKILERSITEMVGTYRENGRFGFVIPDNTRILRDVFIGTGRSRGAVSGHKVVVRLLSYGDEKHKPEGEVTEILGHINDPGVDITSIVRAFGIPDVFPQEVMEQAEQVPLQLPADPMAGTDSPGNEPAALLRRLDLRGLPTVTIDGEDARDLDDAVTLEYSEDGFRLGVHIADVSEYVPEGSPLDGEALRRGTSTYLADRVIPMLPHRLSNGICSLNQGEDRLTLSCIMDIDRKGNITDHTIAETLIRVDRRMTYTAVQAVLDEDPASRQEHEEYVDLFLHMKELADILRRKRRRRGSVDFDMPETRVILNDRGEPVEIRPYQRNAATDIIEDFMLAANETVAEHFRWQELPFVYRVHEKPDPEKIGELVTMLRSLGVRTRLKDGDVQSWELQKMLADIQDRPEEAFITRLALRSMKQARYSVDCTGHFGLAAVHYCHFTSPIRRYPDLQIHRIIKESLRGQLDDARTMHYHNILPEVCRIASTTERRAEEAERTVVRHKMAQYMEGHIGEFYRGVISGVTKWGFYVELPNTVEGLVHVRNMADDHYNYDERRRELIGERRKKVYRMGQEIRVVLTGVDLMANTIDFSPASGRKE